MSSTGPMIWTTVPIFCSFIGKTPNLIVLCADFTRACDDLCDLLRDRRLAGLVIGQVEVVDHLAGVIGCSLHRHAPCALLGSSSFPPPRHTARRTYIPE